MGFGGVSHKAHEESEGATASHHMRAYASCAPCAFVPRIMFPIRRGGLYFTHTPLLSVLPHQLLTYPHRQITHATNLSIHVCVLSYLSQYTSLVAAKRISAAVLSSNMFGWMYVRMNRIAVGRLLMVCGLLLRKPFFRELDTHLLGSNSVVCPGSAVG